MTESTSCRAPSCENDSDGRDGYCIKHADEIDDIQERMREKRWSAGRGRE